MVTPSRVFGQAEADRFQAAAAGYLHDRGLRVGERVAVVCESDPEHYHLVCGALRAGIVPVIVNPALVERERAYVLENSAPTLVLDAHEVHEATAHHRSAAIADVPLGRPMMYTSGTTGRPKGVYCEPWSEAEAEEAWTDEISVWAVDRADRYVQIGPLYHSAPWRFAVCTQLAGGTVAIPGTFRTEEAMAAISEQRATFGFFAPIHLQRLLRRGADLSSYRRIAHAGAPCPDPLKARILDAAPPDSVWEFYGSTEGQFTVCSPSDHRSAPRSVGKARPGRRIEARDGVLWCEPPKYERFVYFGNPEATEAAWDDGWFTVRDVGSVDDRGFVYLDGRRSDLIISGGVNVYPLEVEAALATVRGVEQVAVFGVPDEEWGQAVWAAVVGDPAPGAIDRVTRECLAPFKRPKRIVVVDALPTTTTGKVRRDHLLEALGISENAPTAADRG